MTDAMTKNDAVESKWDPEEAREQNQQNPPAKLLGWRLYTVQFCLCFGLALSVMDSSVIATALVTIGNDFNDFMRIQWVVLAYLLTYLGFALIFSRSSDIIGRKWATITALVILTAFSIGCGCSQTLNQLIAFRALQGIGGSGLYSLSLTVLPEITPFDKIPLMSAIIGVTFTVSAMLGPTLGGVITTHSTWRWVFWFNIPCGGFIIILMLLICPNFQTPGTITWRELDILGCVLYLAASVLAVFALQQAGAGAFPWKSAAFIVCFVVAVLASVALAVWIAYLSRKERLIKPLFPARIVTHRVMLATILASTLVGYVFYLVLVELPERFQVVNGTSSQQAGIYLLAMSGASAVGSTLGGFLSSRSNNTFYTLNAGCSLILLGSGLLYTVGFNHSVADKMFGFEVIIGFGFGLVFSSSVVIIKIHAQEEDSAPAQGLMSQSRILGGNIGLSIATVILNQHLVSDLQGTLSNKQINNLRHSLTAIDTLAPDQIEAVRSTFASAFRTQMEICTCVAAGALVVGLFVWQRHPPSISDNFQPPQNGEDTENSNTGG